MMTSNINNRAENNNDIFDSSKINKQYNFLLKNINDYNSYIDSKKLKRLYILKPIYLLKRNSHKINNKWYFNNINEYFCYCVGLRCLKNIVSKRCKYYFYLYLIDINRNIYNKSDFLLMDFIFKNYTSDDVYPIYEKMINRKLKAHYITERNDIYEKYCYNIKYCDLVIHTDEKSYKINDEFLQKHFTLILKLKQVLSSVGVNINFIIL